MRSAGAYPLWIHQAKRDYQGQTNGLICCGCPGWRITALLPAGFSIPFMELPQFQFVTDLVLFFGSARKAIERRQALL